MKQTSMQELVTQAIRGIYIKVWKAVYKGNTYYTTTPNFHVQGISYEYVGEHQIRNVHIGIEWEDEGHTDNGGTPIYKLYLDPVGGLGTDTCVTVYQLEQILIR